MSAFTLPSMHVADAWLPVWCATSNDSQRPILHRTMCVEWFEGNGVRLIATNSYVLLTGWIGVTEHEPEPHYDAKPDLVTVVPDADKRGLGLIKYAASCAKADKDPDGNYHRTKLAVGKPRSSRKTPALADELEQQVLVIGYEGETVELPIMEAEFPSWRTLLAGRTAEPVERLAVSPTVLDALAKTGREFTMRFSGEMGGVSIETHAGTPIRGLYMPMSVGASVEDQQEAAA